MPTRTRLDKPIHHRQFTDPVIWKNVLYKDKTYAIKVCVDTKKLEEIIVSSIENDPENRELVDGNLAVTIARRL